MYIECSSSTTENGGPKRFGPMKTTKNDLRCVTASITLGWAEGFARSSYRRKYMLKFFRLLSAVEGLSLVILLFIAMPAKYQFGYDFVWLVGMTHGMLWLSYFMLSLLVSHKQSWSVMFWLLVLVASVIPFGFLFLDVRLKRELVLARA